MNVLLRPELEEFVTQKVRAGEYATPSDVISDALEVFKTQQQGLPAGDELRRLIAEGQADADRGDLLDGPTVIDSILARNAKRVRKS